MSQRPARRPAEVPDLPKAPSSGHPAKSRPESDDEPQAAAESRDSSGENSRPREGEQHEHDSAEKEASVTSAVDELPMPPTKQRDVRQTWGTKLRPATIDRLNTFASSHDTHIQDVVEMALDEFMTRRGG